MTKAQSYDVIVVGAGFSGLYMLHRLREAGRSARLYEAAASVGGTWFWNRYPGARVDIESQEYAYSFSPELDEAWTWTERYAAQPELLAYLNHVADRFDLRGDIQLETRVTAAVWNEGAQRWTVATDRGDQVSARHVVMATGCLSIPKDDAELPGSDTFKGPSWHTARWPEEGVDFTDKAVAVIGTGSSAVQAIPKIAEQARRVTVFQRTATFSVPAHNGQVDPAVAADWAAHREQYRNEARQTGFGARYIGANETAAMAVSAEARETEYQLRWRYGGLAMYGAFSDLVFDPAANATAAEFVRGKIREIVKDPQVAEKLSPKTYPILGKRLCADTGYYATFNRGNVTLVDLGEEPIERVTTEGVKTSAREYAVDAIVYAIGFDAMTGALDKIDIRGKGGARLKDVWKDGPRTYLGLMVAGFPNLFLVTGPGSPSVLCNMAVAIEQHVEWISDCIAWMSARQSSSIEATPAAQDAWVDHVKALGEATIFPLADSWQMGANVPGKPRVFMPYFGGFPAYRDKCDDVAAAGYDGCVVSA
jgi:cyclohexanone monooxygenase